MRRAEASLLPPGSGEAGFEMVLVGEVREKTCVERCDWRPRDDVDIGCRLLSAPLPLSLMSLPSPVALASPALVLMA